ncbi:MAG: DUF4349 domain-containing protein [Bacteroidales bacterium]|nr:DUF4349 domain-containing protein [Bacteroidales bacterium]MBN2756572.1 DUF4349 domain-containing protein [Bacteroidales bacterium]
MKTKFIFILPVIFILISCSSKQDNVSYEPAAEEMSVGFADDETIINESKSAISTTAPSIAPESSNQNINDEKIEKKIIKTANVSIEVENFKESRKSLAELLKKYDAYIANEEEYNRDYQVNTNLIIRISSENFDSLLNEICGLATHIDSKIINSRDVTEEFIDITARLKNKKQVEQQYLEILKKAYTITDILNVNEHLRVIREEIEAKEGRLKYLSNQVSFSTINLNLYETIEQAYVGFFSQLLDGFEGGWKGILMFIIGLTYLWPFILILFFSIWLIIRYRKKKKLNKNN